MQALLHAGRRPFPALALAALLVCAAPGVRAAEPVAVTADRMPGSTWPDDRFHRLAALALLDELRVALLTEQSATLTLERWCRAHALAGGAPARVVAEPDRDARKPLDVVARARLQIGTQEPVGYRHVRLTCGGHVLSEADNWYVPARLTAAMNQALDTTDEPFGKVVQALRFSRTTLSSRLLWSPLPADWMQVAGPPASTARTLQIPQALIENRAVLRRADGLPFSLVVETYQRGLLDFAAPPGG